MRINISFDIETIDKFESPDTIASVYYPDEGKKIIIIKGLKKVLIEEALTHEIGHIIDWYLSGEKQGKKREENADSISEGLTNLLRSRNT